MTYFILMSPFLVVTLLVWVSAIVVARCYGRLGRAAKTASYHEADENDDVSPVCPSMTVVVTACNQVDALRRHLPKILTQDYPAFEVVVVDMASTDDTVALLEALEFEHTCLRHTYTPPSARDISIENLAITLGIRAAVGEWVVFTTADAEPASPHWLMTIARQTGHSRTIVAGTVRYDATAPRHMRFRRIWDIIFAANHVLCHRAAASIFASNVAIRRDALVENMRVASQVRSGAYSPAQCRHGVLELIVNRISNPDKALAARLSSSGKATKATTWLVSPQGIVVQDHPSDGGAWVEYRIRTFELRRHLRHAIAYRANKFIAAAMPWLLMIAIALPWLALFADANVPSSLAAEASGNFSLDTFLHSESAVWLEGVAACECLMLIIYIIVKLMCVAATARAISVPANPFTFLCRELMLPLVNIRLWWKWLRTPRREFRKKFV